MKRLKIDLFSSIVAALLLALLLAPAVAQAQGAWVVVPSSASSFAPLDAVASVSANDVWAVGGEVTQHWNGSAWSVVPNADTSGNLLGVAAASTNDVWAVGSVNTTSPPLIEHWNGTSWRTVKAPNHAGFLNAVTAVSSTDVWAVGEFLNASNVNQTLIEHWNGKKWSGVPSPNVGTQPNRLLGVTAVSANDIWAVGDVETVPSANFFQTLTLHWNGHKWSWVASPSISASANLRAVGAVSTSNVWAVGDSGSGSLIEQWNGGSWSVVTHPTDPSTITNVFNGVAIVSATEIWAVGDFIDNNTGAFQTLIELWNGTSWRIVYSPNPAGMQDFFDAASADPSSGQAWAVGSFIAFNP